MITFYKFLTADRIIKKNEICMIWKNSLIIGIPNGKKMPLFTKRRIKY